MPKTIEQKREEAEARAEARAKRTPEEQLALVGTRRGDSYEERCKLLKEMEKNGAR